MKIAAKVIVVIAVVVVVWYARRLAADRERSGPISDLRRFWRF